MIRSTCASTTDQMNRCASTTLYFYFDVSSTLRATPAVFKLISILSLYLKYSTTFYLVFYTNSPAVLSISLSTLFKYTFLFFYLI